MLRTILHLILIAGLLACPLRCFAHSVVSLAENGAETVGCACCDACAAESGVSEGGEDRPDHKAPENGCDCRNCICKGAITQSDAQEISALEVDCCVFLAPVDVGLLSLSCPSFGRYDDQRLVSRYLHGRDARIAHQSFLI